MDQTIFGVIRKRRASNEARGDLLDALLSAGDSEAGRMTDVELRDEIMTLFLAGHETTALALSWTIYQLAQSLRVANQLAEELQRVLGGRAPAAGDLAKLRFTEMVVKESLRLYPPAWGVGRQSLGPFEIGGYRVPAGTNFFLLQWITHRDPRFYLDADRFEPERWRDDPVRSGKLPRFAYFPFGGGPRVCVGAAFAMMEATLLLAQMAQQFRFSLVPNHPVELFPTVTLRPKYGIQVVFHKGSGFN